MQYSVTLTNYNTIIVLSSKYAHKTRTQIYKEKNTTKHETPASGQMCVYTNPSKAIE